MIYGALLALAALVLTGCTSDACGNITSLWPDFSIKLQTSSVAARPGACTEPVKEPQSEDTATPLTCDADPADDPCVTCAKEHCCTPSLACLSDGSCDATKACTAAHCADACPRPE